MRSFATSYKLLALIGFMAVLAGCKQPETVVVDDDPTVAAGDTTAEEPSAETEADFRQLVMGEYNSIPSLDPLFASDAASMRAIQLVYEGLVRLDSDGSIVPGMAESWEVSSDSLIYTFQLRDNIYYHDSEAFSTGTGRRMTSDDIKFVFERMAQPGVPPTAAHLFMDIEGFNSYYNEQHNVYLPSQRTLDGVSGIESPDENTVVFELDNPDPEFLEKLATPLAVIYPQEAVAQSAESFSAVGTGPFQFSSQRSDTAMIFSKFNQYYAASEIELDRVDVIHGVSESDLFRTMSTGDIHLAPQLGPRMLQTLLTDSGNLQESYIERYNLAQTDGTIEFTLRYNADANISPQEADEVAHFAVTNTQSFFDEFPDDTINSSAADTSENAPGLSIQNNRLYIPYIDDPFVRTYLGSLSKALDQHGVQLQMLEIRSLSRNTGLLFTQTFPLIPDAQWSSYRELFRFSVNHKALQRTEITNLNFNRYPWWLDLRSVSLPSPKNLN